MAKKCSLCGTVKEEREFHYSGFIKADGTKSRSSHCKECNRNKPSYQRDYWQKPENKARKKVSAHKSYIRNKSKISERARERVYKTKFGITIKKYDEMLEKQHGVCKICGRPPSSKRHHVNHDHKTGRVRSILCTNCNMMLRAAKDDPTILRLAAIYLEEHSDGE